MNGGTIERTKEWENKRTTELMNGGTIERTKERENERTNDRTYERRNDRAYEWSKKYERTTGCKNKRTN